MQRRLVVVDRVRNATETLGDAVLVAGTRIAAVGRADDLRSPDLPEERFPGATIIPGLRDAHLHPVGHAAALARPGLKDAADFAAMADILTEAMRGMPPGAGLTALRLDDETLAEGRLPDRDLLDRIAPDRPVLLVRYCGHVAVANSVALDLAGVDEASVDPPGGSMDRDRAGRLTGVLRETATEAVTAAVNRVAPPLTEDDLVASVTGLAAVGLTGVGAMIDSAAGCWGAAGSELDVVLAAARRLPIPLGVMVIAPNPGDLEVAASRLDAAGSRVRFTGVKIFSDGSFGGHTAAMYEGFADAPHERGTDRLDPVWCREMARASLRLGGRVAIHAIGDRANGGVLDVMESLIADGADPALLRIEHASVLTETDIARFGRLGVTASVQPAFITSETTWLEKRMGPERLRRTYPFRSLLDAGTPLAGGSDCPVEPPHPLWGMATARDRCGLVPEQALTAAEALALFTTGSATAIGEDADLEPGAPASFTILDGDPVTTTPDRVRTMAVLSTWVDGAPVAIPDGVVTWRG